MVETWPCRGRWAGTHRPVVPVPAALARAPREARATAEKANPRAWRRHQAPSVEKVGVRASWRGPHGLAAALVEGGAEHDARDEVTPRITVLLKRLDDGVERRPVEMSRCVAGRSPQRVGVELLDRAASEIRI